MSKKKKEKVIYYDDGRTISDMSGVGGPRIRKPQGAPSSTAKEKWATYWNAVKMMFGPMMMVITGLCVIYMILYFVFWLM